MAPDGIDGFSHGEAVLCSRVSGGFVDTTEGNPDGARITLVTRLSSGRYAVCHDASVEQSELQASKTTDFTRYTMKSFKGFGYRFLVSRYGSTVYTPLGNIIIGIRFGLRGWGIRRYKTYAFNEYNAGPLTVWMKR